MFARKTYFIGNWKMHGDRALAQAMVDALQKLSVPEGSEIVLCPPATLIGELAGLITDFRLRVGGQDCHELADGAFTGDISADMLRDSGAAYVIVGHSERRVSHGEESALIRKKALRAIKSKLIPIICIGETLAEREASRALSVIEQQLWESVPEEVAASLAHLELAGAYPEFLIAYEPVWAIGTGKTPTRADIEAMHAFIGERVAKKTGLPVGAIPILYGGSVKAANAKEILTIEGVSGVLVGGASLKPTEFCKIVAVAPPNGGVR